MNYNVMITIYGFLRTIFPAFGEYISYDNFKISGHNVVSLILYDWGPCITPIKMIKLEIFYGKILRVFVVKYVGCSRCGEGILNPRNILTSGFSISGKMSFS